MSMDRRGSYISSQLIVINDKLQLLYDEIGISEDERNTRERNLYSAVSHALEQQVEEVTAEKESLYRSCHDLREQLTTMMAALQDVQDLDLSCGVGGDMEIKFPLMSAFESLTKKHEELKGLYSQRYQKAHELFENLRMFSTAMEGLDFESDIFALNPDTLSLTNTNIAALEAEVRRLSEEYERRVRIVQADANQIVSLWAQLGTSQHNIDRNILACYKDKPEMLGLTNAHLEKLSAKKNILQEEKDSRLRRLSATKAAVQHLWSKLSEDEAAVKSFDRANRGIALHVIEAYEQELARLNEKKRDHMHIFIEDARQTLQRLWDSLYFSEDEMLEFTPAWTDIFTDASLAAHESEIARLEQLLQERKPTLALIDAYRELQEDIVELEQSQQDASRLLSRGPGRRDPSRLLREEQMRKRIAKRKPKIMNDLMTTLRKWENENGRPFMVNGERFLDILREEEVAAKSLKSRRTPARPTAASASRTTSIVKPSVPEKHETKTPVESARRQPLQARNQQQNIQAVPPPKQPNFCSTKSIASLKRAHRVNDNASPMPFRNQGSALRHPDTGSSTSSDRSTSTCSNNSPLRAKAAQHRSVSASATISALSKLNLEDRTNKVASSALRAKTALGNYKPMSLVSNSATIAQIMQKQQTLSQSPDKPRLLQSLSQNNLKLSLKLQPHPFAERRTERVKPSISNLSSEFKSPSSSGASESGLENVKPMIRISHEPITIRPDSRDDVYVDKKLATEVDADEDDFIDDYDDEYDCYVPSGPMSLQNDAGTSSINGTILAIDQLSLENNFQASQIDYKADAVIDPEAYPDTEISFISPETMQGLGYDFTNMHNPVEANGVDEHGCF